MTSRKNKSVECTELGEKLKEIYVIKSQTKLSKTTKRYEPCKYRRYLEPHV